MPGRLHFLNYPQVPAVDRLVHDMPPALEHHTGCIATPRRHLPGSQFTGCLYANDGRLVRLSQRPSSGAAFQPVDPAIIEAGSVPASVETARSIYLGNFFLHFGHFLLESLSRLWAVESLGQSFEAYYFHAWEGTPDRRWLDIEFVATCLAALGIPAERVRFIPESGLVLADCVVPQQLFEVNRHASRRFGGLLSEITDRARAAPSAGLGAPAERVYLSRVRQTRRAENEDAIERIFQEAGFDIVIPEELPFLRQVAIAAGARMLAGCAGSNMHLAAFAERAVIVSLDHRLVRNQLILDALREHDAYHVWVPQGQPGRDRWIVDEALVGAALAQVLGPTHA
ncbi:MAG: glycosyltransferase 61 family protein [Acetobacteraceae bacterium]